MSNSLCVCCLYVTVGAMTTVATVTPSNVAAVATPVTIVGLILITAAVLLFVFRSVWSAILILSFTLYRSLIVNLLIYFLFLHFFLLFALSRNYTKRWVLSRLVCAAVYGRFSN